MPTFADPQPSITTKLLLIGASGSGKTGSLASLALAGYNLRILDFDNKLQILRTMVAKSDPSRMKSVVFETLTDASEAIYGGTKGPILAIKSPKAFSSAMKLLTNWKDSSGLDLGPITSWGPKDVLVIDSLSFMARAAFAQSISLNQRLGEKPHKSDFGNAQEGCAEVIRQLNSASIKCNVVVLTHTLHTVRYDSKGAEIPGTERELAAAIGLRFSEDLPRYFSSVFATAIVGGGNNQRRVIKTAFHGLLGLKTPFLNIPKEYPIETGLADYFRDSQTAQANTPPLTLVGPLPSEESSPTN